ncbi:vitamin K epoxide reductase family protein [Puia sp. P3]|uniref:vitamin K epoxide reductase family protein n=1 Tax=Puia sp. P3 TaxID=3423952 RepID=UPI003D674F0F
MKNFANEAGTAGKDPVNIVAALLRELSVPVTDATIRDSLLSHPNYPSLLCVSESLEQWGLDTMALDIAPSGLSQLPCPFLAHCPTVGDDPYWIVKSAGDEGLVCMDSRRRIRPVAFQDFCDVWDGKVLVMEKREVYGEADYRERRRAERWGRVRIALGVLVLLLPMVAALRVYMREGGDGRYFSALLAGNIFGVVVGLLLQGYEYGWAGAGLKRWCSLNGKMSCEAVLQSRGARIWKDVSWGDLGLVYFAGSLAYGWLVAYVGLSPAPLVVCNYLSVGYVIFSLFYQGLVVRKLVFSLSSYTGGAGGRRVSCACDEAAGRACGRYVFCFCRSDSGGLLDLAEAVVGAVDGSGSAKTWADEAEEK